MERSRPVQSQLENFHEKAGVPTASVILTSFNHERYIREAIESVLNQTFTDFELIIWDDCSSDNSWAIINQYSDPRIKAFRNEVNKGPVEGINRAISEVASGKYIAIHHSDDVWKPEKLDKQVAFLDSHLKYGAVFTYVEIIDELNHSIKSDWFNTSSKSRHEWLRQFFLRANHLCHPSVLIRRSSYTGAGLYRLGLPQSADADMWVRLLKLYEIHVLEEKLTLHRLFTDKSNTSADKPEVNRRLHIEWYALLSHFLSICLDDLLIIFPEAQKWVRQEEVDASFILAMVALELATHPEIKLFGLNLLFSLVSAPDSAQRIQQLHNFSHFDFNRLTGNNEIFFFEERGSQIERLNTEIEALQDEIDVAQAEINMFREQLDALYHSTSWKVTAPLRHTRRLIARLADRPRPLHIAPASMKHGTECYQAKLIITPQISRQRIVHVIGNFLTGGSSRLVVDLFEGLGHLYEQEVATKYNPVPPNYTGIPIHEFSGDNAQEKFMNYLRLYRPELIHIHYWEDAHWYGRMINAAREFGCTVILNINTPTAPYIDDCISRYIYVSDYVKSRFGKRDSCSFTIYPGSDFKLFSRDVSQPMPEDCIGMVYRLEIDKLHKKSIDVFIKVVQKRPQTKAIIVGGGHYLEPYKAAVKAAKVETAFTFTGFVPYEKLTEFYAQMSLFVAPVWKESFGQVSPFAMSMSLPVVGYNVGALAEIVGDPCLLAPRRNSEALAEIIIELLDDKERRKQIGSRNRERAHKLFSVENMVNSYLKLYQELMGNMQ
jgi:glycosyltransferase involved in cell wall biosynthesis